MLAKPTTGLSQGFQAIGTYEASAVQTVQWGTAQVVDSSTTMPLNWYYRYPVGVPNDVAIPTVVVFSGGGFDETFNGTGLTAPPFGDPLPDHYMLDMWIDLVRAGGVVISIDYPAADDVPWSYHDVPSDTLKARSVRSGIYHTQRGFKLWRQFANRVQANFLIDPRRMFIGGWSAGGVLGMRAAVDMPTLVCGARVYSCGLGLAVSFASPATSDDHTRDIRRFMVESDVTVNAAPIKGSFPSNDGIIGGTFNTDMHNQLSLFPGRHVSSSFVSVNGPGFHDGPVQMADMEANRVWFNSLMAGLDTRRPSKLVYS